MFKSVVTYLFIFLTVNGFSQTVDSLLRLSHETTNDSVRAEAMYYLTFQYINNDIPLAKKTNVKSLLLAKKLKSNYAFARAYNAKGVIYDVEGKIDSALIQYKTALNFAEKSGSILIKASILNNIGLLDWNKGNFDSALKNYNQSLKLFEQIDNQNGIANTQSNIGLIYYEIEDYKKAEEYTRLSLENRRKNKDDYGISVSLVNIGRIFDKTKKYNESTKILEEALYYKQKIKDERGITTVYNNLTSLYLKLNNISKAIEFGNLALKYSEKVNSKLNLIYSYGALSDAYKIKKEYTLAKKFIDHGIKLCIETDNKPALADFYSRNEEIEVILGNYQTAHSFLKKKDSLNKLMFSLDKEKIISEVEAQYQNEKNEKEIALQKEKLAKNDLQIKNNRLTISLMVFGLLGLLGLLFAYYKRQNFINKQMKKEMQLTSELQTIATEKKLQDERLRISRDLHDNIGSQLTFVTSSIDNLNYKKKGKDAETEFKLNEISSFTRNTISELRDTIWALNQSEINLDNIELRVQTFIEKARLSHPEVQIEFISKDKYDVVFNSLKGINILRFIQEGVNNALKHANPTKITIQIFTDENNWEIKITDNGIGFDLNEISYGFGLENMQKRIAESGGTLHISAAKGKGTELKAVL